MISRVLIFVGIAAFQTSLWAQTVDFTFPSTACLEENIKFQNTSSGSLSKVRWDFCEGVVLEPVASVNSYTFSEIDQAASLRIVEDNGEYFAFIVDRATNSLFRLTFGNSLSNVPTNQKINGITLASPQGLNLIEVNNNWFCFIANAGNNSILRLDFGSSLLNSPSVSTVDFQSNLSTPIEIEILKEGANYFLLVLNFGSNNIVSANLGSDVSNSTPGTFLVSTITGSSNPYGFSVTRFDDGKWRGIVGSFSNSSFQSIEFDNGLSSAPAITDLTSQFPTITNPAKLSLVNWGEENVLMVMALGGVVHRIHFDRGTLFDQVESADVITSSLGSSLPLTFYYDKGNWKGFMFPFSRSLFVFNFNKTCSDINTPYFEGENPPLIKFGTSGIKDVSLRATSEGIELKITKELQIGSSIAPPLDFDMDGVCLQGLVNYSPISSSSIDTYSWSFGDTQTSTIQNPTHQYAATGDYGVSLRVTASITACQNYLEKTVSIYNEPIPDFQIPIITPMCSNQDYLFDNTSTVDSGYPVTWQWSVNGALQSTTEDFNFAFAQTTNQDIMLTASIPGCENDITKSITTLTEGPVVNFSFLGQCEDENVTFTNTSAGTITGYSWDFDDGQNSTDTNPSHSFSTIGTYDVTLTAFNSISGCNNTNTKPVLVYSKPQTNFLLSPPPFSCNGTPSQFNDLTPNPPDSNIASWGWNFGDAGSSQNTSTLKNPQHTYVNSGNYNVSLLVTTNFFCSATLQLPVAISQSPVANFNHGATCEDVASNFSDASSGTISAWNWTIGSTVYTTQNPSHIFNNSGNTSATLSVTASNGCIGTVNKPIVVPVKLAPDFSFNRNCVNQQTVFTDLTNAAVDPLSLQSWNFGAAGTATGSPANVTFANTGGVTVTLSVTTQSGCIYPVSKLVNIISSPQASFNPSPVAGAPPLSVVFTNTSVNSSSYQWTFQDQNNSTSNAVSPTFVYQALGEYQPELTAFNAQNCFHTTSRTVRVVLPVVDIALDGLELMEFQNGFKPAVTIFNRGNVPVINPALLLNMSGSVIREHVNTTITSNTSYRHVFSFEFPASSDVDYFCVEAEVTDITPTDNEVCLSLEQTFTIFPPYPNPSKGSFQLDWIMKEAGPVNLTVINSMGQEMQNLHIESMEGLNPFTVETHGLSSGVYFVKIKYKQFTQVYRVFVSE